MFIECSNCQFRYLVNSADLKPNGRMVECANCGHQWYQELNEAETYSSVPQFKKQNVKNEESIDNKDKNKNQIVKNLPSTVVKQENPSVTNSILVVLLIIISQCTFLINELSIKPIILFDEVCSHLDDFNREILLSLIESLDVQTIMTGTEQNFFSFLSTKASYCNITENK